MTDFIGLKLGNYRILRLIGRGGFAKVYHAEHIYLKTPAAIKILNMSLTNDALESFLNEARTIALLEHPYIVRVLEFGIEGITPFLVMNYAENGTLRQRSSVNSRLPWTSLISYIQQVAEALQYAHNNGVIHCDVKPENILLGKNQQLLLSDFGLAILTQNTTTSLAEKAGTTMYMAPEQLQGNPCRASDQYALAIIVYECLCGSCPFTGSEQDIAIQHLFTPPPSLLTKIPHLSPAIEQVVMKALAKNPQARFATVQAFAQALADIDVTEEMFYTREREDSSAISSTLPVNTVITDEVQYYIPMSLSWLEKPTHKLPAQLRQSTNSMHSGNVSLQLPALTYNSFSTNDNHIRQPELGLPSHSSLQLSSQTFTPTALHAIHEASLDTYTPLLQPLSTVTSPELSAREAQATPLLQTQVSSSTHKMGKKAKLTLIAGLAGIAAIILILTGLCVFCLQLDRHAGGSSLTRQHGSSATGVAPTHSPATTPTNTQQPTLTLSAHTTPPSQTGDKSTTASTSKTVGMATATPTAQTVGIAVTTPSSATPAVTPTVPLNIEIVSAPSTTQAGSTITVATKASWGGVTVSLDGKVRDFGQQIADDTGNATFQIIVPKQGKHLVLTASVVDTDGNEIQSPSVIIVIS